MSFRHTYITQFIYKSTDHPGCKLELDKIEEELGKYGSVHWEGKDGLGYYHGVIKDLDGEETFMESEKIIDSLKEIGIQIKIVFE